MRISGELLAVLAAVFIGISVPIASQASREIGVIQATTYTTLISVAFLLAIGLITRQKIQIKEALTKHFKDSISIVIARPVIGNLLLIYGFSLTTAIRASFLLLLEPIFVTFLSYIMLKDKVSVRQIYLIALMIFGAFLLSTSGNIGIISQAQLGDLLVIFALMFFSYSYIPTKKIGKIVTPMTITIMNNLVGGLILFFLMLFLPVNMFPLNISNIWLVLGYVISFSVIGLYLYFAALGKTKPWIVSSLLTISAISGSIVGYLWLNESINTIQMIGAFAILISSYLIARKSNR
jgi:drug/metabolite transporter (DMT)-like permease